MRACECVCVCVCVKCTVSAYVVCCLATKSNSDGPYPPVYSIVDKGRSQGKPASNRLHLVVRFSESSFNLLSHDLATTKCKSRYMVHKVHACLRVRMCECECGVGWCLGEVTTTDLQQTGRK